jgi:Fe-S cluster assembly iron-binding protein IscA
MKAATRPGPARFRTSVGFIVLLAIVGCSPKPTTSAVSPPGPPPPFVEITPVAKEVLVRVAAEQKLGANWCVRLDVVWKPDPRIEVTIERHPPGPADVVHEANGLKVVMAADQTPYLKGSRIDLIQEADRLGFDVSFPYRTDRDRKAANRWLVEQAERRAEK